LTQNPESSNGGRREPDYRETLRLLLLKSIYEKKIRYRLLNRYARKGQIVFTGSSLMEAFPLNEMQLNLNIDGHGIYTRGIGGATTADLLGAMDECIFDLEPSKIFINIGSTDIGSPSEEASWLERLLANYDEILLRIKERLPECEVYVMAYYPVNAKDDFGLDKNRKKEIMGARSNERLREANRALEELATLRGCYFIDANAGLTDEEGELRKEFTMEGLHLWPNAYAVIFENLKEYLC